MTPRRPPRTGPPNARSAAALALLLALPRPASGSGLDAPQIGTLFSGPTTADPAAVHFNPARLTGLRRPELLLGLGVVGGEVGYTRERRGAYQHADHLAFSEPVDPAHLDPGRTGVAERVAAHPVAPWGHLFAGGPVWRDRLFLGGGLSAPYAAPLRFPDDGPQRFQLQRAFVAVAQASVALAARPHRVVSLGAGVSYVVGAASLARQQDFGGLDLLADALARPPIGQANHLGADAPSTVRELDVLARPFVFRDGVGHGVTFRAGLTLQPVERLVFGASYEHGARLAFQGRFQLDLDDPFFRHDLAGHGLAFPARVEGPGTLVLHLPARVRAGVGVDVTDRVRLDALFEAALWSSMRHYALTISSPDLAQPALGVPATASVDLPRRWRDAFHGALRTGVQVTDVTRLALLAGYQSPASPDATVDVASPDGHRLLGGVGAALAVRPRLTVIVDGQVQGILPRTVTTSDHDLANGRYELLLASLALHLQVALDRRAPAEATP